MDPCHLKWATTWKGKEIESIYFYILNNHGEHGKELYEILIEKGILPSYLLTNSNTDEKQLVLNAILHRELSRLNRIVKYEDLLDLASQKQD